MNCATCGNRIVKNYFVICKMCGKPLHYNCEIQGFCSECDSRY